MARKILLADDSVTAQNMGRKILADAGYDVSTVNNGSAALKRIAEIKPDLIVLDVYMPGYSGLEVCQRLKDAEETAHIPVLLTVGKLEPFKPEEARRVRADAHIVKPFEASELLTAITRLEDRMVPHSEGSGRFSTDPDNGWKSRLGFPSKKKKEEKEEPEDITAVGNFRDFRKGKNKSSSGGAFTAKSTPPGQEPGLVPDIPRDITPEELDALSALAAKLDGPISAAENAASLPDRKADRNKTDQKMTGLVEMPAAEVTAQTSSAAVEVNKNREEKAEEKTEVETPAPTVEPAAPVVEAPALAVESTGEVVIPVEHLEVAAEPTVVVASADKVASEIDQHETVHPETPGAVATIAVNTALLAQESAPVDRNDEPVFASAPSAVVQAAEEKTESKPLEAVIATASAPAQEVGTKNLESKHELSKAQDSNAQDVKAEELQTEKPAQPVAVPVAAIVQETKEAEVPAPSDEELAQALRLLTPAIGHADVSTSPSHPTYPTVATGGPRWVAEPVALSREEAAISLEAEMFRTFAAIPAAIPAAASGGDLERGALTRVSAIAAAVENRLAEAELASAKASPELGAAEHGSSEHGSEARAAETSPVEVPAEALAAVANAASPVMDGIEKENPTPTNLATETIEVEQKNFAARVPEEASAEEVAAATFADAVGQREIEAPAKSAEFAGDTVAVSATPSAEENQDSSSEAGGQEFMGKDAKSKSGKSNWHQIRTAPPSTAASSDVAETAEAPKAMAAAAAEGSSSSSAPDASAIASIVDSVMADLRPKIVEEIAKRLAGK